DLLGTGGGVGAAALARARVDAPDGHVGLLVGRVLRREIGVGSVSGGKAGHPRLPGRAVPADRASDSAAARPSRPSTTMVITRRVSVSATGSGRSQASAGPTPGYSASRT